jgi:ribosomal protein L29
MHIIEELFNSQFAAEMNQADKDQMSKEIKKQVAMYENE